MIPLLLIPMVSSAVVGVSLEGEVDVGITSDNSTSSDASLDSNANAGVDVSGNTSGGRLEIMSSTQISSEADLEAFATNIASEDSEVASVDTDSGSEDESKVSVAYRHRGKFLGFIPVTYKSFTTVTAKADAEVDVSSRASWWTFLVVKEDYSEAELESQIRNSATVQANATAQADARAKARIAEAVIAELEAHTSAQASLNN